MNIKSKVVLANSYNNISNEIKRYVSHFDTIYYIYSKRDVYKNFVAMEYPQIKLVDYNNVMSEFETVKIIDSNTLFIISHLHITSIPDHNLGVLKRSRVCKLIIDNHPFISKSDVWYLYFLYMTFDKTLLGYPHSYAFRDARVTENFNPFDVRCLAKKVNNVTTPYIDKVFNISKIKYTQVNLTASEMYGYYQLKEKLFETEVTPNSIVSKLARYVRKTESMKNIKKKHYNLAYLNRVFDLYNSGIYNCIYSNAKVDVYLLSKFNEYIENANTFIETLLELQNGK